MKSNLTGVLAILFLVACTQATPDSLAPSMEQLGNATFHAMFDEPVTLQDGRYEGPPYTNMSSAHPTVILLDEPTTTGDVTGNGVDETLALLATNTGGTGVYIYLAVVRDHGGAPDHIGMLPLGDRVKVKSLAVDDGRIAVDLVAHGPQDPMCCPTQAVHREWQMRGGRLTELDLEPELPIERYRGYFVWGHEVRSFKGCDGDREGWVVNQVGDELVDVYKELTSTPYEEMFVEVRGEWGGAPQEGFGAGHPESLRITELIRAEGEGFGCDLDINGVMFIANGNEPFWRLHIRPDGLSMWSMDSPGETKFAPAVVVDEDGRITLNANVPDARIQAIIEKKRCVDSMSGARYQFAAIVDVDGHRFFGCALQGL